MGTPQFAVGTLRALYESGEYEINVITQPDKPKGRGYVLTPSEVKVFAEANGLPVYQPQSLRGEDFAQLLERLAPEVIIVAAYGKLLPKNVLDYPKYGCINVHGSILPKYRGAAPIQRAIIGGETETGVTIMYMAEGLDTGDMLKKVTTPIYEDDNFETLLERMSEIGAAALLETLPEVISGAAKPEKQDDSLSTYAAKIEKTDCVVDFSRSAKQVHDLIRGLSPFPLAYTYHGVNMLKLAASRVSDVVSDKAAGTVVALDGGIIVACGDGKCVEITEVLPAGKKRMSAAEFIRGKKIETGDIFSHLP